MNCFSCFQSQKSKRENGSPNSRQLAETMVPETKKQKPGDGNKMEENREVDIGNIEVQSFTFRELASATRNFRQECLLGEGGFGRVYKGTLRSSGQVVAVKQLDRNGLQRNKEFLNEVLTLSLLHHPNLVNLIGYCADGDQRLLVFELMLGGSLDDHLLELGAERKPLNWFARMKIAFGAGKGLEYLHEKAEPPVIFRDLKPSNILLDEDLTPKLSDFGLAKLGPSGDKMHPSSRVMGTYGYVAPEYARSGHLTQKSDVYSFGVILLELITGRRAIDTTKPIDEQNLVSWAQPKFKDPKKYPDMADPLLNKQFPEKDLNQVVAIAAMCLQEESSTRPLMSDVVTALSFLSIASTTTDDDHMHPSEEEKAAYNYNNDQQDDDDDDDDRIINIEVEEDGSDEMASDHHGSQSEEGSSDHNELERAIERDDDDQSSDDEDQSSDADEISDGDRVAVDVVDYTNHQIRSKNMEMHEVERRQQSTSVNGSKKLYFTASSMECSMDLGRVSSGGKNSRRLLGEFTSNSSSSGSHRGTTTVSSNGGSSRRTSYSQYRIKTSLLRNKSSKLTSSMNSLSKKSRSCRESKSILEGSRVCSSSSSSRKSQISRKSSNNNSLSFCSSTDSEDGNYRSCVSHKSSTSGSVVLASQNGKGISCDDHNMISLVDHGSSSVRSSKESQKAGGSASFQDHHVVYGSKKLSDNNGSHDHVSYSAQSSRKDSQSVQKGSEGLDHVYSKESSDDIGNSSSSTVSYSTQSSSSSSSSKHSVKGSAGMDSSKESSSDDDESVSYYVQSSSSKSKSKSKSKSSSKHSHSSLQAGARLDHFNCG